MKKILIVRNNGDIDAAAVSIFATTIEWPLLPTNERHTCDLFISNPSGTSIYLAATQ